MVNSTTSEFPDATSTNQEKLKTETISSSPPPPLDSNETSKENDKESENTLTVPDPVSSKIEDKTLEQNGNDSEKPLKIKPKAPPKPVKKPVISSLTSASTKVSIQTPSGSSSPALLANSSEADEDSLKLYPTRSRNFPLIVSGNNVNNGRPGSGSEDLFSISSTLPRPPTPVLISASPFPKLSTSPINSYKRPPSSNNSNANYSRIANYYNTNGTPISLNGTISRGETSPHGFTHNPYNHHQQQKQLTHHYHPLTNNNNLGNNTNGHGHNSLSQVQQSSTPADARHHNIRRPIHSQPPTTTTTTTIPIPTSTGSRSHRDYQRLHRVGFLRGKAQTDSYKVISFICGFFAAILLVMGLSSTEWLQAQGYRQGLFVYCVGKNETDSTVPFVTKPELATEGCHRIDLSVQGYTLVAAAFCVVSLLVDVFATMLTVMGLRCRDPTKKYKYYRIAVYVMALALVTVLVALVVYPVCFAQIMDGSKRPFWEFGWAYGVGWGASIFLFGGVILLLCDKESEEIYYKERTIVQYADKQ